jgi:hypothetical protein
LIVPPLEVGNKVKKPNNSIEAFVLEHVFLWPWLRDTILAPCLPHFWGLGMQNPFTYLPPFWVICASKEVPKQHLPTNGWKFSHWDFVVDEAQLNPSWALPWFGLGR